MGRAARILAVFVATLSAGCGPDDGPHLGEDEANITGSCDLTPIDEDGTLPACALAPPDQSAWFQTQSGENPPANAAAINAANNLAAARHPTSKNDVDLGFGIPRTSAAKR
jgi:hypothetical protein